MVIALFLTSQMMPMALAETESATFANRTLSTDNNASEDATTNIQSGVGTSANGGVGDNTAASTGSTAIDDNTVARTRDNGTNADSSSANTTTPSAVNNRYAQQEQRSTDQVTRTSMVPIWIMLFIAIVVGAGLYGASVRRRGTRL